MSWEGRTYSWAIFQLPDGEAPAAPSKVSCHITLKPGYCADWKATAMVGRKGTRAVEKRMMGRCGM
jgi:hypothetical protein